MDLQFLKEKLVSRSPKMMGIDSFSRFAVLLPILDIDGKPHLLFEVRSYQLRRQPGEICFPGGKIEKNDKDEQETAIRETVEELGIDRSSITSVFPLDYLVNPFGTIVHPYVGFLKKDAQLAINKDEVAEVFSVPLDYLIQVKPEIYEIRYKLEPEEGFPFDKIVGGEKYNWQPRKMEERFYYYEDKTIWGLTAKILTHFLSLLK